jgi:hypothetical protein
MKPVFYIGILSLLVYACSTAENASETSAKLAQNNLDSTLYEALIIDPNFDTWYLLNFALSKDRSNDYYRMKNNIAVVNWNDYYRKGLYLKVVDSYINYEPHIDYGMEVNRKLFWYFKYVQENYKIQLFW